MKQNERLLVYAVTGFLALILVIAVLFGNDSVASQEPEGSKGLSEILRPKGAEEASQGKENVAAKDGAATGLQAWALPAVATLPQPVQEQPLVAKPLAAGDIVAQTLGSSRRDRMVRFVSVKAGDGLEKLVSRWCGDVSYLAEAESLNEDTRVFREGQLVGVPWVDDEVLVSLIEASKPRTLASHFDGSPMPTADRPDFLMPDGASAGASTGASGDGSKIPDAGEVVSTGSVAAGVETYKVAAGDSLWRIAAKRYGKRNADRMIREIRNLNPDLSDTLQINQELKLPPKSE